MKIIRQEFLTMEDYAGRYRLLLSTRNRSNTKMKTEASRPRVMYGTKYSRMDQEKIVVGTL